VIGCLVRPGGLVYREANCQLSLHSFIILMGVSVRPLVHLNGTLTCVCVCACVCLMQSGEIRQFGDVISRRLGCRFADEETLKYLHSVSFICTQCALPIALFTQGHTARTTARNQYVIE